MVIILIGPPGSGKGTQGKFLSQMFNCPHYSVGDILKTIVATGNESGKLIEKYVSQGNLVPSNLVNRVVYDFLTSDASLLNNCILDGYPRNMEQSLFLSEIIKNPRVIYFDIKEHVAIERILNRIICSNCNAVYSKKSFSKQQCESCNGKEFYNRSDDNIEIIKNRMQGYFSDTFPIIEYYRNRGELLLVNAELNPEEVSSSLRSLLEIG